jgi:hypothetical protein
MTPTRDVMVEEWAAMATNRIIGISQDMPDYLRVQAVNYREQIAGIVLHYMKECVRTDRSMLAQKLAFCGHSDTASLVQEH